MGGLTVEEIQFILELIRRKYGMGYSPVRAVGSLQAKLSILSEVAHEMGRHSDRIDVDETKPKRAAGRK